MELTGVVLTGADYRPTAARVVVEDGTIAAVEELSAERAGTDIVCPAFVNAHTHLGDSIAKDAGAGLSLDELVAPPDGLKHRLLRAADRAELIEGMTRTLSFMAGSGTARCLEFREGGVPGVTALREAAADCPVDPFVFGRDDPAVFEVADGYGASGARDGEFGRERRLARELEKPFAIHAGERDAADINDALDLDPDLLVHMVHAEPLHLDRVADSEIPIAVCPRSNMVTDVGTPPVPELLDRTEVALGTDNVMLNGPSMFREMAFVAKRFDLPAPTVLRMATRAGAAAVGLEDGIIEPGRPASLQVLDGDSDNLAGYRDPVRATVRRAGTSDVRRLITPAATD